MTAREAVPDSAPRRLRTLAAQICACAAIVAMVLCASQLAQQRHISQVERGFWLYLLALPLVWVSLALAKATPPQGQVLMHEPPEVTGRKPILASVRLAKSLSIIAALVIVFVQIEMNGHFFGIFALWELSNHLQFLLMLLLPPLLIWGFSDANFSPAHWRDFVVSRRAELGFVAAVTLGAFVLRLHDLELVRAFVDEGHFVQPMLHFRHDSSIALYQPLHQWIAFPLIYPYIQSLGETFAGAGLVGLRVPSAIFGALTVPAVYALTRQMFDRRTATLAAILILAMPVHLQWSRLGMNNAADPFFGVLMLALIFRGVRRGGTWHFAAAGVCLGFTQYFYEVGRLGFLALAIFWALPFMIGKVRRGMPRQHLIVFVLAALIVAAPIYTTLAALERPFATRLTANQTEASYGLTGDLFAMMRDIPPRLFWTLSALVNRIGRTTYYGGEDTPLIQVYLLPAVLLGIGVLLWRWRTPQGALLLLWAGGIFVTIAVVINMTDSGRLVVLYPALAIIATLGIVQMGDVLLNRRRWPLYFTLAAIASFVLVLDTRFYFDVHPRLFLTRYNRHEFEQEIIFHARDLPAGFQVYYITSHEIRHGDLGIMLNAYNPDVTLHTHGFEELDERIAGIPFEGDQIFYLVETDVVAFHKLRKRFELRGPLYLPNPYNPPEQRYVAYFASADLLTGETR